MLPVARGSVLVTRFTREAVKAGQVDPREVVKLIRSGVSVFNQRDLHAKIYVFPRKAFVGSANASKTSEGLIEACIETSEPAIIKQSRDYVRSLDSDLVTLEYAKSLVDQYPKDEERYFGAPQNSSRQSTGEFERFWISPVVEEDYDAETRRADRAGTKVAKAAMATNKPTRLTKVLTEGPGEYAIGDWLLNRRRVGRGFEFECPGRVVHVERFEGKAGWNALVYLEHPQRQRNVSSADIRKVAKELVAKLCYPTDADRRLRTASEVAKVKRLWPAFRA